MTVRDRVRHSRNLQAGIQKRESSARCWVAGPAPRYLKILRCERGPEADSIPLTLGCATNSWVTSHPRTSDQAAKCHRSSQRWPRRRQRRAMMALAPATVQRMPDCLRRWPMTVLQPASITPDPTNKPRARKCL